MEKFRNPNFKKRYTFTHRDNDNSISHTENEKAINSKAESGARIQKEERFSMERIGGDLVGERRRNASRRYYPSGDGSARARGMREPARARARSERRVCVPARLYLLATRMHDT